MMLRRSLSALAICIAATLSCSDSTGPDQQPPAEIVVLAGETQEGSAGQVAGDSLIVAVVDADGDPVRGVMVEFAVVQGGGSLSAARDTTDAAGRAAVRWTLGPQAGTQRATAIVAGVPTADFTAIVSAAAPASVTAMSGASQNATVGALAPDTLVARVTDQYGNPVGGVVVTWSASAGATLAPVISTTGDDGLVKARLTAGTTVGTFTATAAIAGLAPATFTVTAAPGAPASLIVTGGNQQGAAGVALGDSLVARVFDQYGNAVPGVAVAWTTAHGGSFSPATSTTDAAGRVATRWTLGPGVGSQTATIAVTGLDATTVSSTAGVPSGATLAKTQGDGGDQAVGTTRIITVQARTTGGQPIPGVSVAWSVDGPAPAGQHPAASLSTASSVTDPQGNASTTLTLSSTPGVNTVTASAPNFAAVMFTATGRAGLAATIEKVSGDAQVGVAGQPLDDSLVVRLRDAYGNLVPGVIVTWTPDESGGSVSPSSGPTDAAGVARTRWTITEGSHAVSATAGSAGNVVFTGTGTAPVAYQLQYVRGSGNADIVATTLPETLVVRVVDEIGRVQGGVPVTFAVTRGGGSVWPATTTSDASGLARTQLTLGTRVDTNRVSASVAGTTPVELWNVSRPGPIAVVEKVEGDQQTGLINQALPQLLKVRLLDRYGNATVRQGAAWTGDGIIRPLTNADTNGHSLVRWTPTIVGTNTAIVQGGLATFTATGRRLEEVRMTKVSADSQRTTVFEYKTIPLAVKLTDQAGVPLVGVKVGWSPKVTSGGTERGFFTDTTFTDTAGIARASYQVGTRVGLEFVRFSSPGVPADSFAVITTALEPCNINPWARPSPEGATAMRTRVGERFPMVMGTYASDRYFNPAAGASMLPAMPGGFTVTHHGSPITDSTGWSDTSTVTAGTQAGTFQVRADFTICNFGFPRNQIGFWTFVVDPGPAAQVAVGAGNAQTVTAGQELTLYARVTDQYGNLTEDSGLTWSTAHGTIANLGNGLATWTPDPVLGAKTATATLSNGQSVSFDATVASSAYRIVAATADSVAGNAGWTLSFGVQLLGPDGRPVERVVPTVVSNDGSGNIVVGLSDSQGQVPISYTNNFKGTRYLFVTVPNGNMYRLTATHH